MWYGGSDSAGRQHDVPSLSYQSVEDILNNRTYEMSLLQVAKLPFLINDGKWHHLCITWTTRDGMWEAFQDGVKRGSGENLAPYHPIKPEGVLVLGQEQVDIHF